MNVQNIYSNENLKTAISSTEFDRCKTTENVEYCNCLSSTITNDAWCTCGIKSSIASVQQEEGGSLHQQTRLKFREQSNKLLPMEHSCVWC